MTAAAELGVPLLLYSAAGAAGYAGPGWFREVVASAHAAAPEVDLVAVLDCGAEPGFALAALRAGVQAIALRAPAPVRQKVAAIATQCGARLATPAPRASLDLLTVADAHAACRSWLGGAPPKLPKPAASA